MEIETDDEESGYKREKDEDITQKNLKFLTTDLLQFLTNDKNNEFNDSTSFDILKKQKFMIKNLNRFNGLNLSHDNEIFQGSPGDFIRDELKVRKYFIENQDCSFQNDKEKLKSLKKHAIENNLKKINKYINLLNLLQSKDFEYNMRNNIDFYKYITFHPYLKFVDKELTKDFNDKYSSVGIIKTRMKDNTTFKYSDNAESNNLLDEEYEDDDYNEDEEFYESGDEIV